MICRNNYARTILAFMAFFAFATNLAQAQDPQGIVQRVIDAEKYREDHLQSYTVTENYKLFSPGSDTPGANATYHVEYIRGQGKTYTPVGTPDFHKAFTKLAIGKMVEGQEKASRPPTREHVLFTPENYTMTLVPTPPEAKYICQIDRRPLTNTYAIRLAPIQPRPELIDGVMWVDAKTLRIVRVEGRFSAAPSIFVGRPLLERDYKDQEGFAVAYSSCQTTEGMLAHQLSRISYDDYLLKATR